eukprot:4902842-Pleurochrysis_carterae.AAC.7
MRIRRARRYVTTHLFVRVCEVVQRRERLPVDLVREGGCKSWPLLKNRPPQTRLVFTPTPICPPRREHSPPSKRVAEEERPAVDQDRVM